MNVLVRMLLIGVVLATGIGTQFGAWADSQAAGLQVASPTGEVDVTSTVPEPILLNAWSDLQRGDCVLWPAEGDILVLPTVTDCRDPHDAEISAIHVIPGPDWPSSGDDLNLEEACKDTFPNYVGQQFDISEWYIGWVTPTEAEWDSGDHSYRCYVYLREGQNSKRAYQSGT
jgi:hypothetical protein